MTGGIGYNSSCGACKFLRRKCARECIFAPYFSYDQAATHFAAVHKVFGASNVSKLLLHLPLQCRNEAAVTMSYEALARIRDPVYGCFAQIFALQQQVATLKEEIETIENQMVNLTFDFPSKESFQVGNDSNSWWAFWNDNKMMNQETPLLQQTWNCTWTNQSLSNHTTVVQNPPLNDQWKEDTSDHLHSNSNLLETVFQELGKTGYLQIPWKETLMADNFGGSDS